MKFLGISINPVKRIQQVGSWIRRQAFQGNAVTPENTFILLVNKLGYDTDNISDAVISIALDLYTGQLTGKEIRETFDFESQRILLVEGQKWRERIEALLNAVTPGVQHVG